MNSEAQKQPARRQYPRRYVRRRRICAFCAHKAGEIDYKHVETLTRFISPRLSKIEPRRKTGTCAKHQRRLAVAIKRARHLALLPFIAGHMRETGFSTFS